MFKSQYLKYETHKKKKKTKRKISFLLQFCPLFFVIILFSTKKKKRKERKLRQEKKIQFISIVRIHNRRDVQHKIIYSFESSNSVEGQKRKELILFFSPATSLISIFYFFGGWYNSFCGWLNWRWIIVVAIYYHRRRKKNLYNLI